MSSNKQYTLQQKRKHGDVALKVICELEQYQDKELSPTSIRLHDKLFEMAHKALDSDDTDESLLESAFEFFQKKQKQAHNAENERKSLSKKIEVLEAELQTLKEQYGQVKQEEEKLKAEKEDFDFLLEYGQQENFIKKEDEKIIKKEYEEQNKKTKEEAIEKKKAEAKAKGVQYTGPGTWGEVKAGQQAKDDARWECIHKRMFTSTHEEVEAEKAKFFQWRAVAGDENNAPATPFLDRIQRMCEEAGVERTTVLLWVREYGTRNKKCHSQPPRLQQFWKTITKDGKEVKVRLEKDDPTKGFDWLSFEAAVKSYIPDIEARHANGKIDERRRDAYLEAIDAYWALYSVVDANGNPTLTEYARKKALKLWEDQDKILDPPENPKKRYKVGKWNDIE